jgi:hypothetical protein
MARCVICTIPKSGTYLLSEILKIAGMPWCEVHLLPNAATDYSKAQNLEEARSSPGKFFINKPLHVLLQEIKDNYHAVGHLAPKHKNILLHYDFKIGFLYRNLRDVLVSYARFLKSTGRSNCHRFEWIKHDDYRLVLGAIKDLPGWFVLINKSSQWFDENIHGKISFEVLNGDYGEERQIGETKQFLNNMGLFLSEDHVRKILNECINKETITFSGKRTNYTDYWNDEVESVFKRFGFFNINKNMGYE